MKRVAFAAPLAILAAAALNAAALPAAAQDAQAVVTIATSRMLMPMAMQLPAEVLARIQAPHRSLTVTLMSPGTAAADASSSLDVPAGLGLGNNVALAIIRPPVTAPGQAAPPTLGKVQLYWGCGATIGANQPKSVDANDEIRAFMQKIRPGSPLGTAQTIATYPGGGSRFRQPALGAQATAVGDYTLKSSYAGGNTFHVAQNQDFMAPIEVTAPTATPDLANAIPVSWNPVPGALGDRIIAFANKPDGAGASVTSLWSSGDASIFSAPEGASDDTASAIKGGYLLSPDTTSCTVPAGILTGSQFAAIMIEAIGPTVITTGTPRVRVITISTYTLPIITRPMNRPVVPPAGNQ